MNIGGNNTPPAFINTLGKIVLKLDKYDDVKDFSCGLAAASFKDDDNAGYIDHQGKMVIGPIESAEPESFDKGLAIVSQFKNGKSLFGVVSLTGTFVIPVQYDHVRLNTDGNFLVEKKAQQLVLDRDGKLVIKFPANCTWVDLPDKISKETWIPCGFGGKGYREKYRGLLGSK